MRKGFCLAVGMLILSSGLQYGRAQEKSGRTLRVNVHYKGSGAVDDKHKIFVFLFDSPEFIHGGVIPFAMRGGLMANDQTVAYTDVAKSPVYVSAVYDPSGSYDGKSGPPPTGASLGMYSKTPGQPEPVNLEDGKTVEIDLAFDDTVKMP